MSFIQHPATHPSEMQYVTERAEPYQNLSGFMSPLDSPLTDFNNLHDEIHIWTADLDRLKADFNDAKYMLPESEQVRAKRFRFEKLRKRYTQGHTLLRILIGKYLGEDFYDQEFCRNKHGKPFLKQTPEKNPFQFNLSNSENIYVIAFTKDENIGVDVEKIHDLTDMDGIVEHFFSPPEKEKYHVLTAGKRKSAFFRYWTRKEALLKAMGIGLTFSLDKLDVMSDRKEISETFLKTTEIYAESEWTLKDLSTLEGFASALALNGNRLDNELKLKHFQLAR